MITFYKTIFFIGVFFTIATVVLSQILGNFDMGIDLDIDGDFSLSSIFPIKPITVVSFLAVFGGLGWNMSLKNINAIITFISSLLAGYAVSILLYKLILKPLLKIQDIEANTKIDLIGASAIVKDTIPENGFGAITYEVNGNSYSSPAKSKNNERIEQGSRVVIFKILNNVFYVLKY